MRAGRAMAFGGLLLLLSALTLLPVAGLGAELSAQVVDTLMSGDTLPDASSETRRRDAAPLVYIDCNRCDFSHIRRELTFVNHVREPSLGQVHVLITDQSTGGGGRRYTLAFSGRQHFQPLSFALTFNAPSTASSAEEREGLTEILKLGLASFAAQTTLAPRLRVSFDEGGTSSPESVRDPWKNWTFEVYGGGNVNTETSQSAWSARYGFYANRVTEEWKIRVRPYFNNNVRTIESEDETIRSAQRRHGFESYVIRSLGEHWGTGFFGEYTTTTFDNLRNGFTLRPAVEYSLFPYAEASTKQITVSYGVGYEIIDYFEETIYERTEESLLSQRLNASVQIRQPWGSISSSLTGSHYLPDFEHHRLTFSGRTSFRVAEGVSLNFGGSFQRINDQIFLPRGDASLEDILLQRRQLATSYRVSGNLGLSYTFGSIFSNVVNPRL